MSFSVSYTMPDGTTVGLSPDSGITIEAPTMHNDHTTSCIVKCIITPPAADRGSIKTLADLERYFVGMLHKDSCPNLHSLKDCTKVSVLTLNRDTKKGFTVDDIDPNQFNIYLIEGSGNRFVRSYQAVDGKVTSEVGWHPILLSIGVVANPVQFFSCNLLEFSKKVDEE